MKNFKDLIVSKNKETGYTTYQNLDKELQQNIVNHKNDITKLDIKYGHLAGQWNIISYEGDKVRCEQDKNVYYFDKKYVEELLQTEVLDSINRKFIY